MLEGVEELGLEGWSGSQDTGLSLLCSIPALSSELGSAGLSVPVFFNLIQPHSPHLKRRFRDPSTPNEEGLNYQALGQGQDLSLTPSPRLGCLLGRMSVPLYLGVLGCNMVMIG